MRRAIKSRKRVTMPIYSAISSSHPSTTSFSTSMGSLHKPTLVGRIVQNLLALHFSLCGWLISRANGNLYNLVCACVKHSLLGDTISRNGAVGSGPCIVAHAIPTLRALSVTRAIVETGEQTAILSVVALVTLTLALFAESMTRARVEAFGLRAIHAGESRNAEARAVVAVSVVVAVIGTAQN